MKLPPRELAALRLDLAPDRDLSGLTNDLAKPRGKKTMATHLERRVGMTGVKVGLLREVVSKEDFADPAKLAAAIKSLSLKLIATRPLAESISSAGGVIFEAVDAQIDVARGAGGLLRWRDAGLGSSDRRVSPDGLFCQRPGGGCGSGGMVEVAVAWRKVEVKVKAEAKRYRGGLRLLLNLNLSLDLYY